MLFLRCTSGSSSVEFCSGSPLDRQNPKHLAWFLGLHTDFCPHYGLWLHSEFLEAPGLVPHTLYHSPYIHTCVFLFPISSSSSVYLSMFKHLLSEPLKILYIHFVSWPWGLPTLGPGRQIPAFLVSTH